MTITITLNEIKAFNPCNSGWIKLLASLNKTKSDDTPVTFSYIAESNGVSDSLWCLRVLDEKYLKERCYLMADIVESVAYLYTKDTKVEECIKVIKEYGAGLITIEELNKKRSTVYPDASAVYASADASAVYASAYAAVDAVVDVYTYTAVDASTKAVDASSASASAFAAVYASASASAFAAVYASASADAYALSATSAAAVEREKQKALIKKYLG